MTSSAYTDRRISASCFVTPSGMDSKNSNLSLSFSQAFTCLWLLISRLGGKKLSESDSMIRFEANKPYFWIFRSTVCLIVFWFPFYEGTVFGNRLATAAAIIPLPPYSRK